MYPEYLDDRTKYHMLQLEIESNPRLFLEAREELLLDEESSTTTQVYIGKDATRDDFKLVADLMQLRCKIRLLAHKGK